VDAAAARSEQAGAFPNPVVAYTREQTSSEGHTNWQNIALLEQRLDISGQRGARRDAALLRRDAALARVALREAELTFEVTRAYAAAVAADRRAALAREAAEAFGRARRITAERLAAGDISGYTSRRIGLESARYAALNAEAELARRSARLALGAFIGSAGDSVLTVRLQLSDSLAPLPVPPLDSLRVMALRSHHEIRAVLAEADANAADARAARKDAFPGLLAGVGFKNERPGGSDRTMNGFVVQLAVPVPLWDRRGAASAGFTADSVERAAQADRVRRDVAREVEMAWAAMRAVEEQVEAIRPELGQASRAALGAAVAAFLEGEISLVEWLDAVRAYQEVESTFAGLQAEHVIQRAALERVVGVRLN
jgi:cobalt-zinc-cadmium efflux system outer membrane protein